MLELRIIEGIRPDNPTVKTKIFGAEGGIIGRDAHCAWVLMDRQKLISGAHAKIIFSQGAYYLSDISTNGVFNHLGQPVGKGELRKLNRADIYIIGPYRIEVSEIKLADPTASLREAGLQHLLLEQKETIAPLAYAQKANLEPEIDFSLGVTQAPHTLKAYDFMPEPIDLLLKPGVSSQVANPCLPEDVFKHLSAEVPLPLETVATEAVTEAEAKNLPVALSGVDFLRELCQAFHLDYRLLGTQTQSELHQKIITLVQGVLALLLELKTLEQNFTKNFSELQRSSDALHNPLKVAVSQRQLFELIMRDDPEFMQVSDALTELRQVFLARLQQMFSNIPHAQRQLLSSLAPEVIMPKSLSKFNLLQDKQAWQAYQQHYQNLAADNARVWLEQFNNLLSRVG